MVTEFLSPGTRSSDLRLPPNIFVTRDDNLAPEDRVTAARCLGPTSIHPLVASSATGPARLAASLVGEEGTFEGVAIPDD